MYELAAQRTSWQALPMCEIVLRRMENEGLEEVAQPWRRSRFEATPELEQRRGIGSPLLDKADRRSAVA